MVEKFQTQLQDLQHRKATVDEWDSLVDAAKRASEALPEDQRYATLHQSACDLRKEADLAVCLEQLASMANKTLEAAMNEPMSAELRKVIAKSWSSVEPAVLSKVDPDNWVRMGDVPQVIICLLLNNLKVPLPDPVTAEDVDVVRGLLDIVEIAGKLSQVA